MEENPTFKVIRPPGPAKPDKNAPFHIVDQDSVYAKTHAEALQNAGDEPPFKIGTRHAPSKCPFCGTMAVDYRNEHPGQELLLLTGQTGHPFVCAVCGNMDFH